MPCWVKRDGSRWSYPLLEFRHAPLPTEIGADATGLIARYKGVRGIINWEEIDEAEPHEYFGRDR